MTAFCLLPGCCRRFYNRRMRFALFISLSLCCIGAGHAESPSPSPAPADAKTTAANASSKVIEQRAEKIHVEDASASIDELRVGGETRSIKVQPKGGMPAYEVAPSNGERSWKILGF